MSKKGKLILATAVFGAALFAASCGGGDNGGTTAGGGSGGSGGGGGTEPTEEGRVLALLNVGSASEGPLRPVTICQLKSDNKAYCGSDLNPTADVELRYLYEFGNGNVVLKDTSDVLYFFNGSQVIRPTIYRTLGGISDLNAPGGITIPTGTTVTYYATPNFLIIHGNSGDLVVVTREGKVISDNGITLTNINASCEAVTKSGITYKLNTDGTSFSTAPIPTTLASAGGKFLVKDGDEIYLTSDGCSASGVEVDNTISGVNDAKMVAVVEGTSTVYYIAVRASTNLHYYRVSGNMVTNFTSSGPIVLATSPDKYYYALDGRGVLYAITNADRVSVYRNTDGESAGTATVGSANFTGLLGLADRVLAKDASGVYQITTNGSTASAVGLTSAPLLTALNRCTDASDTRAINGEGTNFIRCVFDNGNAGGERLAVIVHNGSGNYSSANVQINSASGAGTAINQNNVRFGANNVLVVTRDNASNPNPIYLCTITTTPAFNVSCSVTDLPNPVGDMPIRDTTRIYPSTNLLKFSGNDVFYLSGSTLKVGDIFGSPMGLSIPAAGASGGNASFDLNRFAFSFGPAFCRNQIVYLSSRTANQKTYTIVQPSNACVARILKVFQ